MLKEPASPAGTEAASAPAQSASSSAPAGVSAGGPAQSASSAAPAGAFAAKARPRMEYLDIAKGFAAASVVLLHLFSDSVLFKSLAPWHIWQAMPIFLFIAGITGAMSCRKYTGITGNLGWKKNKEDLAAYYRNLPARALGLYIPYAVVTVLYYMWAGQPLGIELFFNTMLMGYLGPGGYFVPLIVQHLIFFPLVLSIRGKVGSDLKFLGIVLGISIAVELPFAFTDAENFRFLYRIFYFRYLFACALGAVMAEKNPFSKNVFRALALVSIAYIGATCYLSDYAAQPAHFWNLIGLRADDWYFQHYPSYFYTAFIIFAMRDHEKRIPLTGWLIKLGKSSYEIFIFQMLFFITIALYLKQAFGWADLPLAVKVAAFFFCIYGGLAVTWCKAAWKVDKK